MLLRSRQELCSFGEGEEGMLMRGRLLALIVLGIFVLSMVSACAHKHGFAPGQLKKQTAPGQMKRH